MTETLSPALPEDVDRKVRTLLERACDLDLTLVTAESCTGGLLASLLTDVEGCSHAFERGFVTYTDEAKTEQLGVPPTTLRIHGAVSKPVAIAMAEGALAHSRGQIAISITGFAGPAGEGDEEGLVHFALARHGSPTLHHEAHFGPVGRGDIRLHCLRTSLDLLAQALG